MRTFITEYANLVRNQKDKDCQRAAETSRPDVEQKLAPSLGPQAPSLFLLFRGEDPCRKLSEICGALYSESQISTISLGRPSGTLMPT